MVCRAAAWKAAFPVRRLARRARPTLRPRRSAALPLVVSMSHVTPAGLGSQVSCPRAHAHLAGGRRVRGTPLICIYAVAGTGREITVRNAVFGELRLARRARPTWLGGTPRPTRRPRRSAALPLVVSPRQVSGLRSHVRAPMPTSPAVVTRGARHLPR